MTVSIISVPIDPLTAEDQIILRVNEVWPQEIGTLAIPDGPPLVDRAGRSGSRW